MKNLLTLRRSHPALTIGSYQSIGSVPDVCFVYLREHAKQRYLIALNCSANEQTLHCPQFGRGHVRLSTHLDYEGTTDLAEFHLRANEGWVIELDT